MALLDKSILHTIKVVRELLTYSVLNHIKMCWRFELADNFPLRRHREAEMILMNIFIKPIVIFILLSLFSSFSLAADIPPGQAIGASPGKSSIRFELNSVKLGEGFRNGESLNLGSELNVNTLGVQYSRSFMIRDRLAGFYINGAVGKALPGGSISSQEKVSGITDSAAALVTWLYADMEKGRYVVLRRFVIFPTGDYDSDRTINFSQNRFSRGFQF